MAASSESTAPIDNPLSPQFCADQVGQYDVVLGYRKQLAADTYLVRFVCPELAARITPGQFVMVRTQRMSEALLGRAFALYDVIRDANGNPESIDVVFHTVGKMTNLLAEEPIESKLVIWGPLGNGFHLKPADEDCHLIMVAGGIGQTPFLTFAKECLGKEKYGADKSKNGGRTAKQISKVSLCYGARNEKHLAGVEDFRSIGVEVHVATDDGSAGHAGFVTELLAELLENSNDEANEIPTRIVCCGPEPMMEAVAGIAQQSSVPCEVSLETPMACGLGICFSCVTKVKQSDGSWDFKRTCVDGPVFGSDKIVW